MKATASEKTDDSCSRQLLRPARQVDHVQALARVGGLAVVEHHHAARAHVEQRAIMGREQHRGAGIVDVFQQPENVEGELGVEIAGGFVGQHQRRLRHDGTSDGDALLLAA
jgi:hypothetical protein